MIQYGSGEDLYWDDGRREVRFTVPYNGKVLLFRVEGQALETHLGASGNAQAYVLAARKAFGHITHRISDKLSLGLTEPDGSVLIRAKDW